MTKEQEIEQDLDKIRAILIKYQEYRVVTSRHCMRDYEKEAIEWPKRTDGQRWKYFKPGPFLTITIHVDAQIPPRSNTGEP